MKKIIVLLVATVMPFSAAVAEGAFDGVNLQLGLGASVTKSQENQSAWFAAYGDPYNQSFTFNKTNFVGSVSLGYSYGLSNQFNLAANVFYNASSNNAGSNTQTSDGSSMTRTMSLKNVTGISFEPGYYFAKDILGYFKLGVAQASSSMSFSFSDGGTLDPENFGRANGVLLGFGGKYAIAKNIYLGAEFYQINFAKKTNYYHDQVGSIYENSFTISNQPTYSYGGLTLGYHF